jgi:hypothetical protein
LGDPDRTFTALEFDSLTTMDFKYLSAIEPDRARVGFCSAYGI